MNLIDKLDELLAFGDPYSSEPEFQEGRDEGLREARQLAIAHTSTTQQEEFLRALVDDLTDDNPCWFDHHGYCQEHLWFTSEPTCPHYRSRKLTESQTRQS